LVNVFFRGYGRWHYISEFCNAYAYKYDFSPNDRACGVFKLSDEDESEYRYTKSIPSVSYLRPCTTHPDCEFSKRVRRKKGFCLEDTRDYLTMEDAEFCYFYIDNNQERVLTIVEPFTEAKTKKTDISLSEDIESAHVVTQVEVVVNDAEKGVKQTRKGTRGQTQINIFLTELCQKQDINNLSGESLVRAIKPLVGTFNCPVKKYHGFYDDVCVDWKEGTGSTKGTWGKKSFQNFVTEFKAIETKKPVK
jgi:hypothetical protein